MIPCEGGAALNQNLGLPRIVVGIDGSSASLAALRWAVREAGLRQTALHVVRAWEDTAKRVAPYASHAYPPDRTEDLLDARQWLEAEVTAAVSCASASPIREMSTATAGASRLIRAVVADPNVVPSGPSSSPSRLRCSGSTASR